jgi:hypothetical protein
MDNVRQVCRFNSYNIISCLYFAYRKTKTCFCFIYFFYNSLNLFTQAIYSLYYQRLFYLVVCNSMLKSQNLCG